MSGGCHLADRDKLWYRRRHSKTQPQSYQDCALSHLSYIGVELAPTETLEVPLSPIPRVRTASYATSEKIWSPMQDFNPRHPGYKPGVLSAELIGQNWSRRRHSKPRPVHYE